MAVRLGVEDPIDDPDLWFHNGGVFKAVLFSRETGYQFSSKTPASEVVPLYRIFGRHLTLERFAELLRMCEKKLDEKLDHEHRSKDRREGGETGR